MDDRAAMEHALALAERARGRVSPNPPVGCVIVADGGMVGEGWTQPPPGAHAEAMALAEAGEAARGAQAYVTLEPCAHRGRTPPCAQALAAAGLSRVVYAVAEPSADAGGGAARLRAAGVTVEPDREATPVAARQLAAHLHAAASGRPRVIVKLAVSLDGRVAAADGTSQWVTGSAARQRVHWRRAQADAVLIGAGTAVADDPRLTVRDVGWDGGKETGWDGGKETGWDGGKETGWDGGKETGWDGPQPLRVVLDGRARVSSAAALADTTAAPTLVVVGPQADPERVADLERVGVETLTVTAGRDAGDDLRAVLASLWDRDVREVLVEGGATVAGAVVAAGLVDQLEIHLAGALLGEEGLPALSGLPVTTLADAPRFTLDEVIRCGDDLVLTYLPRDDAKGP